MTEDEFRALLAIEGKSLRVTYLESESRFPLTGLSGGFLAIVLDTRKKQTVRHEVAKTYDKAIKAIIKSYYANN